MSVSIEISESHIDALIDFYIQRLKVLRDEIATRERESKDINSQILKLKKGKNSPSLPSTTFSEPQQNISYSEKWPWVRKIRFAIELQQRPLTTKEIIETLTEYEVGLMFDRKKAVASVSSILSTKSGANKEFVRMEGETGDFTYYINQSEIDVKDQNNDDLG